MVVISGALCTVEDYVIMSQCAHNKAINLAAEGTVSVTDISKTQNITIVGLPDYINNDFKITLYAKDTQRYLCFNENWKLVGMRELRETCYFNETIVHGYFVFRSVVDLQRRVGFTHRGKAIGPRKNVTDACYLFTKIHSEQFFHQHTTPKPKATTYASSSSGRTTAATAATTTSKSKGSRNNRNKNNYDRSNGMRNTSDNQNRQHVSRQESNTSDSSSNTNVSAIITQQHSTATNVSNTHRQQQQQQQQQHHQVRHHHNDPNVVARRHQHEHKQKQKQRRQRNRTRATTSPTTTATPTKSITKPTTTQIGHRAAATATPTAFNSNKAAAAATSAEAATQAAKTMSTKTETNSSPTTSATTTTTTAAAVAHKRKGRRRKGNKMHKQPQHHMLQQQLPVNAKDPQHRRAHKKALHVAATQPAVTHQQATNSSVVDDDVPAAAAVDASAARGTVASAVDYSSLSTDWSSVEPTSTTTAESLDYDAASSSSSTASLLPLPSAWTPRQSSPSAADVDASSALLPTDSESSMLPATADTISSATYKLGNVAATSTLDSNAIYASAATNTQPALDELFGSAFGSKPTATTYDATNTWAAATLFDDLATTQTDAAAPTPWLTHSTENRNDGSDSWISTSSSTTETESNSSSSSSSDSFEATEELSDIQATAETKTIDGNDDVLAESGDATSRSSSNTSASSNENENFLLNLNNQATIQRHVAGHTEQQHNSSPNKNVDSVAATFPTWQTTQINTQKLVASAKRITKQPTTKTTTFRQEAATGSSGTSTSNNLDYSTTDYLFSTRSSSVRNKNHKHRQQQQQQQQEQQQQQQQQQHQHHQQHIASNNNNNNALKNPHKNTQFLSPKATHNKHHVKLSAPAATFKTAATYLPATIGTTLVSSNPLDLLFGITWPQNTAASEYDSLRNVHHKNINNNQHNTLLDYNVGSSSNNSSSLISENAITPTTATRKHLRKSTQKLLATPFHQLTYVRNHDGDIDIDNIDNISVYSDLSEADVSDSNSNGSTQNDYNGGGGNKNGNSRMTIVSGYLPTSATATLPESIRIAKIKINKVRKRMLRQRYVGERA